MSNWKSIEGYPNYSVSDQGEVRNDKTGLILKPRGAGSGYFCYNLYNPIVGKKNLYVHRLVALAFIPNHENKATVNHINGIKSDNRVDNLEWNTSSENHLHARRTGLSNNISIMKPVLQFDLSGNFIREWSSGRQAGMELCINPGNISNVATGKINKTGGYVWKYKNQNTQAHL